MNKILASAYGNVTRRLFLNTVIIALFLLIVIAITIWAGNTLTMITAIARFERTHTVSRVEAMVAFYDYRDDKKPEELERFYEKLGITQSYNKVFSRLLDMRKDTPDDEFVRILETTFSETDHKTAVIIVNRIKVLYWHPILKNLVADSAGAHAAGEVIKILVDQFLATNDRDEQKAILARIDETRRAFIVYENSFSKSCSDLSNQVSSYVTYVTIALLIVTVGFISLLTYQIAKTVIQHMARDTLALRETNELLALFVRHSPIYTYIKEVTPTESRILQASENFERMIGVKGSDMVGKTMAEVFPAALAAKTLIDDLAVVSGGKTLEVEEELNGRSYTTLKFPIIRGGKTLLAGFTIDITERKQAEEIQRSSEHQLVMAQQMGHTGSWVYDPATESIWGSAEGLHIFGFPAVAGDFPIAVFEACIPERERVHQALVDLISEGRAYRLEYAIHPADGSPERMVFSVADVERDSQGKPLRVLGFLQDITARKQAEEEKAALQAQLQQSQKMESLGTLAGGVAHDMNNVLGAILGLASAHISTQPYGSPLHKALDTICKATERGGKMVKSLLSFARQSPAENNKLDMNAILQEQVALLEHTTLSKVRLQVDLEPNLRLILGDASALTHAFMNLCVNAVDAMPENGTLNLRTRNVDNDWIEVVVEDNGLGMPKEVLEKAMEPFFTTKGTGKGTGLGLSMVFSTVKAHRGQMAIQSDPGLGTRVMLRFPACEQATPVLAPAPAVSESTLPHHGSLKVLLVDDDDLVQSSVQAILEVLGHTALHTAQSGEEALAMLAGGYEPDLVILDMNMPGLGGIGTLPRLRGLRPRVPVLLATGRVDQTALTLASAYPGVTLLSKPFGLRELQKHMENIGLG